MENTTHDNGINAMASRQLKHANCQIGKSLKSIIV